MSDPFIQVFQLGKKYRIGRSWAYHNTLRDTLSDGFRHAVRWLVRHLRGGQADTDDESSTTIWALRDVSFEVGPGDVLGIIGDNGAGKSTLLRILSFVTEPTEGYVRVRGRVGSLLEIGTGFHSELTGRENIYLSGAILGMKKSEIDRKFDEIVTFAGVERFIDTQIKHYSDGMYMRLGFAVAAHLDPEILLVDEVLAVGDADFQSKCIGSMQALASSGRTVLVVSHNMTVIDSLCRTALWLDRGRLRSMGEATSVISAYMAQSQSVGSRDLLDRPGRRTETPARFTNIQIRDRSGDETRSVRAGSGITVALQIEADHPIPRPCVGIELCTPHNQLLSHVVSREAGYELPPLHGECTVVCHIDRLNLLPERYYINLTLSDVADRVYDEVPAAAFFDVTPADVLGTGRPLGREYGVMFFPSWWEVT